MAFTNTLTRSESGERAIIKFKNQNFLEMHNAGYRRTEANEKRAQQRLMEQARNVYLGSEVDTLRTELLQYLTRERLVNVCSKLTEEEARNQEYLRNLFVQDAFKDFKKVYDASGRSMNNSVRKKLDIAMQRRATNMLDEYVDAQAAEASQIV